jgi:hypothetical protein
VVCMIVRDGTHIHENIPGAFHSGQSEFACRHEDNREDGRTHVRDRPLPSIHHS